MSVDLEQEVKELRTIIFNMLNFTNMYCLVLDQDMIIRYINASLAIDLGYDSYHELLNKCWIDFIPTEYQQIVTSVHAGVSMGIDDWESKYREVHSDIIGKNGKQNRVYWFNSHINSEHNWMLSFGIKKNVPLRLVGNEDMDDIREYYHDILNKDRVLINSIKDATELSDKIARTCKPNFVEDRISVG